MLDNAPCMSSTSETQKLIEIVLSVGIKCISRVLYVKQEMVYSGSGAKFARVSLFQASGNFVRF